MVSFTQSACSVNANQSIKLIDLILFTNMINLGDLNERHYPADKVLAQMLGQFLEGPDNKHPLVVLDITENLEVPSELVW